MIDQLKGVFLGESAKLLSERRLKGLQLFSALLHRVAGLKGLQHLEGNEAALGMRARHCKGMLEGSNLWAADFELQRGSPETLRQEGRFWGRIDGL